MEVLCDQPHHSNESLKLCFSSSPERLPHFHPRDLSPEDSVDTQLLACTAQHFIITSPNTKAQRDHKSSERGFCFPGISFHPYSCKAGQGTLHGFTSISTHHTAAQFLLWAGHQNYLQNLPGHKTPSEGWNSQPPEAQALVKSPFGYMWRSWIKSVFRELGEVEFHLQQMQPLPKLSSLNSPKRLLLFSLQTVRGSAGEASLLSSCWVFTARTPKSPPVMWFKSSPVR